MNRHNNHGTAGSLLAVATFISFAVLAEANLPTRTVVLYPVGDSMVRYSQPDTAFPSESLLTWYQDTENNEYAKSYVQWQLPDDCDPRFITGARFRVWVTDTQTRGTVDFYGVLDGVTTANPETYTFNTAPGLEKDPTKWGSGLITGHFDSATARHLGGIHNNDFLASHTEPYEAVSNVNFGDSLQLEWLRSLNGRIATAFFSARHAIYPGLNLKSWFASREHPDYPGPGLEITYTPNVKTAVLEPVGDSMVRYSQPNAAFPNETSLSYAYDEPDGEYAAAFVQWELPADCDPAWIFDTRFRVWVVDHQQEAGATESRTVDFVGIQDGVPVANPETYTWNTAPGLEKDTTVWAANSPYSRMEGGRYNDISTFLGGIHHNDLQVPGNEPYEAVSDYDHGRSLQLAWLQSLRGRKATAFFTGRNDHVRWLWFASREHPDHPGPRLEITYVSHTYADLDGNGVVDLNDFAILAGDWLRSAEPGVYPGDLSQDGHVGPADLEMFVEAWLKGR